MRRFFHNTMEISSAPLDLTTPEGVKTYLAQTSFQATDVTVMVGGNGNFTYRVTLKEPFSPPSVVPEREPQPPITRVILKHAEPYAATNKNFPLDLKRQVNHILPIMTSRASSLTFSLKIGL